MDKPCSRVHFRLPGVIPTPGEIKQILVRVQGPSRSLLVALAVFAAGAIPVSGAMPFGAEASTGDLMDQGYKDMYNLAFDDAHRSFKDWERGHPRDAMGPVSDAAAYLYSEFDRLKILQSEFFVDDSAFLHRHTGTPDPVAKRDFEAALNRSGELADAILKQSPDDERALLATVLRFGLHADYTALIEKRYLASVDEVKQARAKADYLLARHPECYDAYLASGFENYMLSLKAAPVRWFLRMEGAQTDKETGLAQLRLTAEKGHYLKPFAELLLAVAALRDKNGPEAKRLLSHLMTQFPGNQLYRDEFKKIKQS
jgi:hypothetical protein